MALRGILLDTNAYTAFMLGRPEAREIIRRAESISLSDISQGYRDLYLDYASAVDPFAAEFEPRRLIRPGEPHFTAIDERSTKANKEAARDRA